MTEPVRRHCTSASCMRCGGPLPCIRCALELRKERCLVGKEPVVNDIDLRLDLVTAIRATTIREEGYTDQNGVYHKPWDEREYRRRAGLDPDEQLSLAPVPKVDDRHPMSEV